MGQIALFYFYLRYIWKYTDFEDLQNFIFRTIEYGRTPWCGAQSGLKVSCPGDLDVAVSAGQGFGSEGRLLILELDAEVTLASPVGNPARSLVVLRPVDTDADDVTTPIDSTPRPLHQVRTAEVVVINGTPAATPSYPAIEDGDLILAGFLVPSGAASVDQNDIETYKRDVPAKGELRIRRVTSADTAGIDDDVLEVNTASIDLPADPSQFFGKKWTFINYRSAGNAVTVDGNGNDVSGQSDQVIDDQWGILNVYCNGVEYVVC